jgi:hypothetical protein
MSMTAKHHIIGLCGLASVGKDTVGNLLATHAGFRTLAFANPLRVEAAEAFWVETILFTRREFKESALQELALSRCGDRGFVNCALLHLGELEPNVPRAEQLVKPRSPRWILQLWGTEYRRADDADYWTRQTRNHIQYLLSERLYWKFAITDVRFPNEAEAIRAMGGQIWQIKRPGITAETTTEGAHASASDGSQFAPDVVINNAYDMKHLQQLVLGEFWALESGLPGVQVRIP